MSFTINYPFDDDTNYTFDDTKIEVAGSQASLILIDNTGQDFTQDFANDTGFTYNNLLAEFLAGKVQQKDQTPENLYIGVRYNVDEKINFGSEIGTGVLKNGAVITGGYLDTTGGNTKSAEYTGLSIPANEGAIKFIFKPDFTTGPSTSSYMLATTGTNNLFILIYASGAMHIYMKNDAGGYTVNMQTGALGWVAGVEKEILLNWNISGSIANIYIDGTRHVNETTFAGVRTIPNTILHVGSYVGSSNGIEGFFKDLIVYDTVQETGASYTPGYSLPLYLYLENKVDLPQFAYSGVGVIKEFNNFVATQSGTAKWIVNSQYWNGSIWTASDDSYSQANTPAEILTNIGDLTISDTVDLSIVFEDSNTISDVDNVVFTYTGQIYSTDNPTIEANTSLYLDKITDATETAVKTGSDELKYVIKNDGKWYWFNGVDRVETDGITYAESNTIAEWAVVWPLWDPPGGVNLKWRMFIHSDDGSTTPTCQNIAIEYDSRGNPIDDYSRCKVFGYSKKPDGTVSTEPITAKLTRNSVMYKDNINIDNDYLKTIPQSSDGYWELHPIETVNMSPSIQYVFNINKDLFYKDIPDETERAFNSL